MKEEIKEVVIKSIEDAYQLQYDFCVRCGDWIGALLVLNRRNLTRLEISKNK